MFCRKNQKGFTLIELVLVMSLMGLFAYLAIPKDTALLPMELESATRKVATDLRYAQDMATTTGDSYGFQVTGLQTYQVYDVNTGVVATSPLTNSAMNENLSINFKNLTFQSTTYQVIFDSKGKPTTGGGLIMTLLQGGQMRQIEIMNTSGFVKLL